MPKNTPIRIIDSQKTRGAVFLGGSGTSGGVVDHGALLGLGDNDHPQYVLTTTTLEAGAGLTGGGALSAGPLTFAVGQGNLITVSADSVAVANGTGTYQFIGTGAGTTSAWHNVSEIAGDGLTHTTALNVGVSGLGLSVGADAVTLTSSSSPGAAASILASDAAGALALTKLRTPLLDTAAGNMVLQPAGDLVLDPVGNDVFPQTNYDINLGALNLKFLSLHAAELWVETLVAQNTIATIGGRILVGPTTSLTRDLAAAATTIYVKHNEMASGDRTYMEANGKVEFFAITSGPTGTGTDYSYTVTRNLDGTGANDWYAGDAMFNTGTTGEGFIDLYSLHGVKAGTEYGPTIVGNIRLSSTYNDWEERWAVGNLNGLYDYGTTVYGFAAGDPDGANVTVDATYGVRLRQGTTDMIALDISGNSYFAGVMTIGANGEIRQGTGTLGSNYTGLRIWRDSSIGRIGGYNNNTLQWYGSTDGKFYFGNGKGWLERYGLYILAPASADLGLENNVSWATQGNLSTLSGYINCSFAGSSGSPDGQMLIAVNQAGTANRITLDSSLIRLSGDVNVTGEINVRQHTTTEQWSLDVANGTALTIANTFVFQFSDASVFSGLVIVTNTTDGGVGMFTCGGGVVVKVADGSSVYSTTKDTASKTNLYYDAGSNEYRMQNNTGGSRTYSIFSVRTRASS